MPRTNTRFVCFVLDQAKLWGYSERAKAGFHLRHRLLSAKGGGAPCSLHIILLVRTTAEFPLLSIVLPLFVHIVPPFVHILYLIILFEEQLYTILLLLGPC